MSEGDRIRRPRVSGSSTWITPVDGVSMQNAVYFIADVLGEFVNGSI